MAFICQAYCMAFVYDSIIEDAALSLPGIFIASELN